MVTASRRARGPPQEREGPASGEGRVTSAAAGITAMYGTIDCHVGFGLNDFGPVHVCCIVSWDSVLGS